MQLSGVVKPTGKLEIKVLRGGSYSDTPARILSLCDILYYGLPRFGLPDEVFYWRLKNIPNLMRGFWKVAIARLFKIPHFYGALSVVVVRGNGQTLDYGLATVRVVTNAGVAFVIDAFQGTATLSTMRYHAFGSGTNAESVSDTALQTEFTTEYATDNTRPTGTQGESAANSYRTVAMFVPDGSGNLAVNEQGIFSQAATGGGTVLDRNKFNTVNLNRDNGDGMQTTYDFQMPAGG